MNEYAVQLRAVQLNAAPCSAVCFSAVGQHTAVQHLPSQPDADRIPYLTLNPQP